MINPRNTQFFSPDPFFFFFLLFCFVPAWRDLLAYPCPAIFFLFWMGKETLEQKHDRPPLPCAKSFRHRISEKFTRKEREIRREGLFPPPSFFRPKVFFITRNFLSFVGLRREGGLSWRWREKNLPRLVRLQMENLWGEQSWTKQGGKLCRATKEGKGEIASWRIGEIKIFFQENRAGKKTFSAGAQITFITRGWVWRGERHEKKRKFCLLSCWERKV